MEYKQKIKRVVFFLSICWTGVWAQSEITFEEYRFRRDQLRELLPENGMAVFFSAPIRNRSNDTNYNYHPDRNMLYLTGWEEPHAVLLIYKNPQQDAQGNYSEELFVRDRDAYEELWNGTVVGVARAQEWGIDRVRNRKEFLDRKDHYTSFDALLLYEFQNDVRDKANDPFDLYALQKHFRQQINYPNELNAIRYDLYQKVRQVTAEGFVLLQAEIRRMARLDPGIEKDALLQNFLAIPKDGSQEELKMQSAYLLRQTHFDLEQLPKLMGQLREQKSPTEIELLKKAIAISVIGQIEVMKALHPEMSEREIQGIHEFVYKKYGAADVGYPSIVGAGNNGCVLHYSHNELEQVNNQLVLMDLGAEYKGYTADVTRTIPANGRFTAAQRELYEVVYQAQEAAIAVAQVGTPFSEITQVAYAEVSKGLMALGIIEGADELRRYLPHGVTHHIGLDVHDPGAYEQLKPNMIITVEPGIYIPKGSPCDPKWWEIGIRIEDDILITTKGLVNLSAKAPRHWKAIEVMMQEDSVLREWKLPELEN